MVSARIRAEILETFYGINKLHIEMGNFKACEISPQDWWKAIGDTNLRMMKSLNFFVRGSYGCVMVKYRQTRGGEHLVSTTSESSKSKDKVREVFGVVEADGLHVQALENLFSMLRVPY